MEEVESPEIQGREASAENRGLLQIVDYRLVHEVNSPVLDITQISPIMVIT